MARDEKTNRLLPGTRVRILDHVQGGTIRVAGKWGTVERYDQTVRSYLVRLDGMDYCLLFGGPEIDDKAQE